MYGQHYFQNSLVNSLHTLEIQKGQNVPSINIILLESRKGKQTVFCFSPMFNVKIVLILIL